jgi:hypothetical protein
MGWMDGLDGYVLAVASLRFYLERVCIWAQGKLQLIYMTSNVLDGSKIMATAVALV